MSLELCACDPETGATEAGRSLEFAGQAFSEKLSKLRQKVIKEDTSLSASSFHMYPHNIHIHYCACTYAHTQVIEIFIGKNVCTTDGIGQMLITTHSG